MVFIDRQQSISFSEKRISSGRILRWVSLADKLLEKKAGLIRVYYYNARVGRKEEPERYIRQQSFFNGVMSTP